MTWATTPRPPGTWESLPASLRLAYAAVAAADELEHLGGLQDEQLELYAREAAAEAHRRGLTEVSAADIQDLAAWLRGPASAWVIERRRAGQCACGECQARARLSPG